MVVVVVVVVVLVSVPVIVTEQVWSSGSFAVDVIAAVIVFAPVLEPAVKSYVLVLWEPAASVNDVAALPEDKVNPELVMFIDTVVELPPVLLTIKLIVIVPVVFAMLVFEQFLSLICMYPAVLTTSEAFLKSLLTSVPEAITVKE